RFICDSHFFPTRRSSDLGLVLALAFGYLTSGETGMLIGILITFAVAQFFESYFLEPYLVGDKVDLHPFMVILVVVLGGSIWGIIDRKSTRLNSSHVKSSD